jgi:hypothetical protein
MRIRAGNSISNTSQPARTSLRIFGRRRRRPGKIFLKMEEMKRMRIQRMRRMWTRWTDRSRNRRAPRCGTVRRRRGAVGRHISC